MDDDIGRNVVELKSGLLIIIIWTNGIPSIIDLHRVSILNIPCTIIDVVVIVIVVVPVTIFVGSHSNVNFPCISIPSLNV